jgi:hypothetical protein
MYVYASMFIYTHTHTYVSIILSLIFMYPSSICLCICLSVCLYTRKTYSLWLHVCVCVCVCVCVLALIHQISKLYYLHFRNTGRVITRYFLQDNQNRSTKTGSSMGIFPWNDGLQFQVSKMSICASLIRRSRCSKYNIAN